ncbi:MULTISPECIES: RNA polymerase sigma-70 factor [Butyricimonas]|uniref:RNA polymerase sigma-70 factor n=1 Tax=Butyricimonas TaxID=574697 RepID=UPI0007FB3B13|nr:MULTISPECIES: RNA polymerase sigma-70 factor [Butyricimonas]
MSEREEIEWLRELKAGNDGAYKVLFGKFYAPLCAFASGFVNDTAVAEDIVQEIFFKLYTDKPTFEAVVALKSYLYLVTKNHCLNYLKHVRIEQEYISSMDEKEQTTFFFNQIVEQELLMLLTEAIEDLPEQTGKVFQLVMEGFDNAEIAEKLNLSIDSVKSHKKRGKQFLKNRLGDITAILLILSNC